MCKDSFTTLKRSTDWGSPIRSVKRVAIGEDREWLSGDFHVNSKPELTELLESVCCHMSDAGRTVCRPRADAGLDLSGYLI